MKGTYTVIYERKVSEQKILEWIHNGKFKTTNLNFEDSKVCVVDKTDVQ